MEPGRVSKRLLHPIPSTYATGQWSYAVMELGRASKKLLHPIPFNYPTGPWSYAVMELRRVSKNYYIQFRLPMRKAHGAMHLMEL